MTIVYIGFHITAVVGNELGDARSPLLRIQWICFLLARVGVFCWVIVMITFAAIASKRSVSGVINQECRLQIIGVIGSSLALYSICP